MSLHEDQSTESPTVIVQHIRRPQWGMATLVEEGDGRKVYHFTDGKVRTFREEYCGLLEAVELSEERRSEVMTTLSRSVRPASRRHTSGQGPAPLMPFSDQLKIFQMLYPGGFQDPKYLSEVRGRDSSRNRKRFRDPVVKLAAQNLGQEVLEKLLEEDRHTEIITRLVNTFARTDMVQLTRDVKPLRTVPLEHHPAVAQALVDLLYGDKAINERLLTWRNTLMSAGLSASWPSLTAPLMLVHPHEHICVRQSIFAAQARLLASGRNLSTSAHPSDYLWVCKMVEALVEKLNASGLKPEDRLDVFEFIWSTLRPAGRKLLDN